MNKKRNKWIAAVGAVTVAAGVLAGCGGETPAQTAPAGDNKTAAKEDTTPLELSVVIPQVGDIPAKGNVIEQEIEKYTNTKLNIQWVPSSTYDEKVNVMIAAGDLPKILRVNYIPTSISAMQSGQFWELGPYLKDYKNLSAQNQQYYENIKVDGKIYGIPQFREIGRNAIVYRKDLLDNLGLQVPKTIDEWYNVLKAMTLNDPDKNGKNDTYGLLLDKKYNDGTASSLTRFAVTQGAPNRWGVDNNGKFTPEFVTQPFMDTLKLFRKLYAEKLINQDFPALDSTELEKQFESGRAGMKINSVATNATGLQDRIVKNIPSAVIDVTPWEGPQGIRIAGGTGNNGILVIPKSSVKTEAELKRILTFMDKLFDPPMSVLQKRGIEGTHYKKVDNGMVEWVDFTAFNREVKPYRDNFLNFETYNVPVVKDTPLGMKATKMEPDGLKYSVANPALNLTSQTYSERGRDLELMITDAETKYIVGKIDDAGWQAAVDAWRKAGGDKLIKEYEESYAKNKK